MKEQWNTYKKQIYTGLVLLFALIMLYHLMDNNYGFYENTIGTIRGVEESVGTLAQGPNGEQEQYYEQTLTIQIRNGDHEDEELTLKNTYSESQMKTVKYQKGEDVFLVTSTTEEGTLQGAISGVKRDKYLAVLVLFFLILMGAIAGKQGALTLLSLGINVAIFIGAVFQYIDGKDFILLSCAMVGIFTVITMFLLGGITRKSLGAVVSCIVTVAITFGIYELVCMLIEEPPYEMMEYIVSPDDLKGIFTAGTMIGCLGAVMDVAITMNSSIHEIVTTSGTMKRKDLYPSIRAIGHDVCGTMISVMFFSFLSGTFPITIIKIKNGYGLLTLFRYGIVFEATRFLVGSIGIVLAIPVSAAVAVLFVKKGALVK